MGYALLWIEVLVAALLFVATMAACIARLRRRGLQLALWVLAVLPPFLVFAALAIGVAYLKAERLPVGGLFYSLLAFGACFVVGAIWVRLAGLRPVGEEPATPAARDWSRGKLAIALLVSVVLCLMTFWNLGMAATQQASAMRAEAGSLALSVAPARIADRDNAALVYQQAFEAMGDWQVWPDELKKWDKWTRFDTSPSDPAHEKFDPKDPELPQFLKSKAPALALLHRAAELPGCFFDREYGQPSIDMLLPELSQMRNMARLLALDTRAKAAQSDGAGAVRDLNAMFIMAEHCSEGPILVSLLVAIAIDHMAADTLEAVLATGELTGEDLAAVRIGDAIRYGRLLKRALIMEEAFGLSVFCQLHGGMDLAALTGSDASIPPGCGSVYSIFFLQADLAEYRSILKRYQRLATEPYHRTKDRWARSVEELEDGPCGILTNLLVPALSRCAEMTARADARRRLVRLGLALARYHAKHQEWPDGLDELTPDFIVAVPRDPFDGQPLRLKQTAAGRIVYSIGPDGKDDGARPFDRQEKTGDITFKLGGP